jgi:hypothetical protein
MTVGEAIELLSEFDEDLKLVDLGFDEISTILSEKDGDEIIIRIY